MTFDAWFGPDNANPECRIALKEEFRAAWDAAVAQCAEIVRLGDPVTTYYSDSNGEERECIDWDRTAEKLERLIREQGSAPANTDS